MKTKEKINNVFGTHSGIRIKCPKKPLIRISALPLLENMNPNILRRCSYNDETRNNRCLPSIQGRKSLFGSLINQPFHTQSNTHMKYQGKKNGNQYLIIPQQLEQQGFSKSLQTSTTMFQDNKIEKNHSQLLQKLVSNNVRELNMCQEKKNQREQSSKIISGFNHQFRIHKIQNKIPLIQHNQTSIEDSLNISKKKFNQQCQEETEINFMNISVNVTGQSQNIEIPNLDPLFTDKMNFLANSPINQQNIQKNSKDSKDFVFFENKQNIYQSELRQTRPLQGNLLGQIFYIKEVNESSEDEKSNSSFSPSKNNKQKNQLKQIMQTQKKDIPEIDNFVQKIQKNDEYDNSTVKGRNYEELILNYLNKLLTKNGLSQFIINFSWFRRLKEHRVYQIKQYLYMNPLQDKKIFQAIEKYEELLLNYRENYAKYLKNDHRSQPFDKLLLK